MSSYLKKSISYLFLFRIIGLLLSIVMSAVNARLLGSNEFGVYSFVIEMMLLLSIPVSLGIPNLLIREIAKYNSAKEYGLLRGMIKWSNMFVGYSSLILVVLSVIILFSFVSGEHNKMLFFAGLPIVILKGFSQIRMGTLRGLKEVVKAGSADSIIQPSIMILSVVILSIVFDDKITSFHMLLIYNFAVIISVILGSVWLIRSVPKEVRKAKVEYRKKDWLRGAIPFFFLGSIGLVNGRLSILFVGMFESSENIGFYRLALTGASLVTFLLSAVNATVSPLISEYYHLSEKGKLQKLLDKTVIISSVGALLVCIVFVLFGKLAIEIVYGTEYLPVYPLLLILTAGQVINAFAGSVANLLNMSGNQKYSLFAQISSAIISVILNLILLPVIGVSGAAIASAISMAVWNILMLNYAKKRTGFDTSLLSAAVNLTRFSVFEGK